MGLLRKNAEVITPEVLVGYGFEAGVWGGPTGHRDYEVWDTVQVLRARRNGYYWGPEKTIYEKSYPEKEIFPGFSTDSIHLIYFPETYSGGVYNCKQAFADQIHNPKQLLIIDLDSDYYRLARVFKNSIKFHMDPHRNLTDNEVNFCKAYCSLLGEKAVNADLIYECKTVADLRRLLVLTEELKEIIDNLENDRWV